MEYFDNSSQSPSISKFIKKKYQYEVKRYIARVF